MPKAALQNLPAGKQPARLLFAQPAHHYLQGRVVLNANHRHGAAGWGGCAGCTGALADGGQTTALSEDHQPACL